MAKNETYLTNVDVDKVTKLISETDKNVEYFNIVSIQTAEKYTKQLDDLMKEVYIKLNKSDSVETEELEKYILKLNSTVYFIGSKLEQLNIYSDMANAATKEVYNRAYLDNQVKDVDKKNKTTVAENQAAAEMASQYESIVGSIYDHAYKIVKFKIESANNMISTIKKVVSKRMLDKQLASQFTGKETFEE